MGSSGSWPKRYTWIFVAFSAVIMAVAIFAARSDSGLADVVDNFEMDADHCAGIGCSEAEASAAYYAGIEDGEDDWATNAAVPQADTNNDGLADCQDPGVGAQPAFLLCNTDRDDVPTCYGSRVVENPGIIGQPVFICDGNSGSNTLQGEEDIVSSFSGCSDQKTNDDRWCVKQVGVLNNPAKTDETHGYVLLGKEVVCDTAPFIGETHTFIIGGYERLGNEGTVFAGFVFYQVAPLVVDFSGNSALNFVDPNDSTIHFRSEGDILILLNQAGQTANMSFSIATDDDSNADTVAVYPAPTPASPLLGNCGSTAVIGPKLSGKDSEHVSVLAPPWSNNFCDPSGDPTGDDTNGLVGTPNNQCKEVRNNPPGACSGADRKNPQLTDTDCADGGTMVPPNDFVEWAIDLTAEGIETDPCDITGVLMTSRSSDVFTADLKDVNNQPIQQICDIAVDKTGDNRSKDGDDVDYTITISNPGEVEMHLQDITDTLLGDFFLNGVDQSNTFETSNDCNTGPKNPLQPGDTCTITATRTVNEAVDDGPDNPEDGAAIGTCGDSVDNGDGDGADAADTSNDCDPDGTLQNLVTVVYNSQAALDGVERTADDDHSVLLVHPSVEVTKTGPDRSKDGDTVTYTIEICNTGDVDLVEDTIVDDLLGDLAASYDDDLIVAECESHDFDHVVDEAADGDPVDNTVTVHYDVGGSGATLDNDITANDSHSVDLVHPSVSVTKTGDTISKDGDTVNYNIEICNTGDVDLDEESIVDTFLGDLAGSFDDDLDVGECEDHDFTHVVNAAVDDGPDNPEDGQAIGTCGDSVDNGDNDGADAADTSNDCDPDGTLQNLVTVHYDVGGTGTALDNDITDDDDHAVDLFAPSLTLVKECSPPQVTPGATITYTITITNTSSSLSLSPGEIPDLVKDSVSDSLTGPALFPDVNGAFAATLATGAVESHMFTRDVQPGDPNPLENTATAHYHPLEFLNDITDNDSCEVEIVGCALSPGFWGGGDGRFKWDQAGDPIAIAAMFTTTTPFPWVDATEFPGGLTYLDMFGLPKHGDVTIQMVFKYVAARLNEAAFGVPTGIDTLLDDFDTYFMANPVGSKPSGTDKSEGQALLSQLNAYFNAVGEEFCPDPADIPEL